MGKGKWWILTAIIWMILIFTVTQLPFFTGHNTSKVVHKVVDTVQQIFPMVSNENNNVSELNLIIRKITHVIVFGILAVLLLIPLRIIKYSYILAWFFTFLYAVTDEWHQSFVSGRVASFKDVLLDSFGSLIALLTVFIIRRNRRLKKINNMSTVKK